MLFKELGPCKNLNDFLQIYSQKNMLLVFMNCDEIIKNENRAFTKMLLQIIEQSKKTKILLVSNNIVAS